MSPVTGKPKQERSRRTLEKLLAATAEMLEKHGLEGATVPRIAAQAGVSVGSVYRRFEDKDALFRATFLDLIERSVEVNKKNLRPETFAGMTLETVARALVRAMVRQFRVQPGLLGALQHFLQYHPDLDFRECALEMIAGNYGRIAGALMLFRDRITHAHPERAALFAILSAITVIQARTLENDSVWEKVAALDDRELEAEVTDLMVAYLTRPARGITSSLGML
ncbi:MAG: TetR/AcrR family transcriptional regulator [Terracidiphilus sp.]